MRVLALLTVLTMTVSPALAGGFYGGMAEGMQAANEIALQEKALELDARDGGNRYERLRNDAEMRRLQKKLDEVNKSLEELKRQRGIP